MSLSEKVEQLNREISAAVERALAEVRQELSARLRSSNDEIVRHLEGFTPDLPTSFFGHEDFAPAVEELRSRSEQEARQKALGSLLAAVAELDRARSQAEILTALLDGSRRFASRAALLLVRGEELRGWDGRGWNGGEGARGHGGSLRDLAFTPSQHAPDTVWSRLADARQGFLLSAPEAAELCSRLEGPLPNEALLLPMVLRDRVAAALYADRVGERGGEAAGGALDLAALRLLTYAAAQAIETLPFRERSETATLADLAPAAAEPAAGQPAQEPAGLTTARVVAAPASAAEPATAGAEVEAEAEPQTIAELEPEALAEREREPEETAERESISAGEGGSERGIESPASQETQAAAESSRRVPVAVSGPAAADLGPPPGVEPSFLDDSLAFPSRHTTELPLPESQPEEPPRPRPVAVPPSPAQEPPAAAEAERADGRIDTVLLPRPGFREGVSAPWSAWSPAQAEQPEEAHAGGPVAESPEVSATVAPPAPEHAAGAEPTGSSAPAAGAAGAGAGVSREGGAYQEPTTAGFEPLRTSPLTSGTPEVRPPSGVQGPGWAFATTRLATATGEDTSHEEARRLARLLVSEIKLYNEEQVEAGRRNRDIYERLREDIDRSRQMYEERVEPRLAKSTDYFYQELVRILAAGDSKALGI